MIGPHYWSTGVVVWWLDTTRWRAKVYYYDNGFCDDASTEGILLARDPGSLSHVVDLVKADAERLGVKWRPVEDGAIPTVFYEGDGQHPALPAPPLNWRTLLNAEATRLGWAPGYDAGEEP